MKTLKEAQEELNQANLALTSAMRHIVNVTAFLANIAKAQEAQAGDVAAAAPTLAERAAGLASHMEGVAAQVHAQKTSGPTPVAAAPSAPTPAAPAQPAEVDPREAQEFLTRTLHNPGALFSQMFSGEVHPFGRGIIKPSDAWPAFQEDVSATPKHLLAGWPTGFYRSANGDPQFFLSIPGRFFGWTTIYADGTNDFSFYSQDPSDSVLYQTSKVTDLLDAKRLFGTLKNAMESLIVNL